MRAGRPLLSSPSSWLAPLAATLLALAGGCATYQTELKQGIQYHASNEYEKSLAIFRALEPDIDSLKDTERVQYYYFRGMTDHRLTTDKYDVSPDARHWLSLAAAGEGETPSSLSNEQVGRMCRTLGDLNRKSYNQGSSDAPVVEFKVCKDRPADDGKADDDAPRRKKDDDDDRPRKKSSDDEKPRKKSDE
jgi:hypothetical protein